MRLFSNINGYISSGIISETEAYEGATDKASHAYGGRRTARTEVLHLSGGISYVYLCYGIHHLFNVVTGPVDIPHAVLIRGIIPDLGIDEMLKRCGKNKANRSLSDGPGKVSKALGIDISFNKLDLDADRIWIEGDPNAKKNFRIKSSKRIGIDYAEEDALLPYRFQMM